MVRMRYLGIGEPRDANRRYAVWRADLAALRLNCAPMREDYLALDALIKALDATATHFTGEADFYGGVAVCFTMNDRGQKARDYEH